MHQVSFLFISTESCFKSYFTTKLRIFHEENIMSAYTTNNVMAAIWYDRDKNIVCSLQDSPNYAYFCDVLFCRGHIFIYQ